MALINTQCQAQRAYRGNPENTVKIAVHKVYDAALRSGKLERPYNCSEYGQVGMIEGTTQTPPNPKRSNGCVRLVMIGVMLRQLAKVRG
jgi:hypothetical protein